MLLLFGQLLVLLFNLPIPFGEPVEGQPRSLPLQRNGPLRRPANLPDLLAGGLQLRPVALANGVQAACALPGARTSRQRSSSQRASASSARTRSRSQRNFQSNGPGADASGSCPSSAKRGTGGVLISSMRISMRGAIARRIFRYQP